MFRHFKWTETCLCMETLTTWMSRQIMNSVLICRFSEMIDYRQSDILDERHGIRFNLGRHLINHRMRHFLQLGEDNIGSFIVKILLNSFVFKVMGGVATMQFRNWSLIVFGLSIRVILLLVFFVKSNSFFSQILFSEKLDLKSISMSSNYINSHRRFDVLSAQLLWDSATAMCFQPKARLCCSWEATFKGEKCCMNVASRALMRHLSKVKLTNPSDCFSYPSVPNGCESLTETIVSSSFLSFENSLCAFALSSFGWGVFCLTKGVSLSALESSLNLTEWVREFSRASQSSLSDSSRLSVETKKINRTLLRQLKSSYFMLLYDWM